MKIGCDLQKSGILFVLSLDVKYTTRRGGHTHTRKNEEIEHWLIFFFWSGVLGAWPRPEQGEQVFCIVWSDGSTTLPEYEWLFGGDKDTRISPPCQKSWLGPSCKVSFFPLPSYYYDHCYCLCEEEVLVMPGAHSLLALFAAPRQIRNHAWI